MATVKKVYLVEETKAKEGKTLRKNEEKKNLRCLWTFVSLKSKFNRVQTKHADSIVYSSASIYLAKRVEWVSHSRPIEVNNQEINPGKLTPWKVLLLLFYLISLLRYGFSIFDRFVWISCIGLFVCNWDFEFCCTHRESVVMVKRASGFWILEGLVARKLRRMMETRVFDL